MKKALLLVLAAIMTAPAFAYVPLSNAQAGLGSFRLTATQGMFYNELDILSAAPVELNDFKGNNLYTTWGNVRNDVNVSYNPALSYRAMTLAPADNTFVFGAVGTPLKFMGIKGLRLGGIFQNGFGGKVDYFNLDNNLGLESEGKWDSEVINAQTNGVIDRLTTCNSDLKNYDETTLTQWNVGGGMKLWILGAGLGINRISAITTRNTGGKKTYNVSYLTDAGMLPGFDGFTLPAGTRQGNSATVTYADNSADDNSTIQNDFLPQARIEVSKDLKLDVGLGLRFQNTYNPDNLLKNGITVSAKTVTNFSNGATTIYNNEYTAVRNPVTLGFLNYNDFSAANIGDAVNPASPITDMYNPAWTGGTNAPAVTDFKDDRTGAGPIFRAEAKLSFLTGVFNYSTVSQDIDAKITSKDYIRQKSYWNNGTIANPSIVLEDFLSRDFNQTVTQKGSGDINNLDMGVKVDLIDNKQIKLAFAPSISRTYNSVEGTQKTNTTESTSYDDGVAQGTAGNLGQGILTAVNALAIRPSAASGEGVWSQTTSREDKINQEITRVTYNVPVGIEIPLSKSWTFRAGTAYAFFTTETVNKTTSGRTTAVTSATPVGGVVATQSATAIVSPAANVQEDKSYTEGCTMTYSYGIEWKVNDSLTIATNAFLDTNPNLGNDKASLFDLDTYRCLAIQAVFHF